VAKLPWIEPELDHLRSGCTYAEFAERYPTRSYGSYRQKAAELGLPTEGAIKATRNVNGGDGEEDAPDARELVDGLADLDPNELVRALFRAQMQSSELYHRISPSLSRVEHSCDDGLPVGVAFIGDMHIGADFVDTDRIEEEMLTIRDTDGLFAIGMGDYVEGITKDSKAIGALVAAVGAVGNRDVQDERAITCLGALGEKLLVMIDGNHDSWLAKQTGSNHTARIAREIEVPYFREAGGSVYLDLCRVRYHIAVKHTYRGNSRLNTTNAQRTAFGEWPEWTNCDIVTLAHYHFNDMHQQTRKGGVATYLRSGTWKLHDSYSTDLGYKPEWGIPIVVLYPRERRVVAFRGDNFDQALRFLATERDYYRSF
jgi:hypothetical protein